MFKRLRWLSTGAAVGLGGSFWLQRKMKTAATRYGPAGMVVAAANRARDALDEGRIAMQEREAELRGSSSRRPAGKSRSRRP